MKKSILFSIFIHILSFFLLDRVFSNPNIIRVELQEGGAMSLSFSSHTGMKQDVVPTKKTTQSLGTVSDAISTFQNSISYPALALEQGWETECAWEVVVGEGGLVSQFKLVKNCKYQIFQTTVESNLKNWKFSLEPGQSFTLPVHFRIQTQE